jgi:hypothetical protein
MCELICQKYNVANNLLPVSTYAHLQSKQKILFHVSEELLPGERAYVSLPFAFFPWVPRFAFNFVVHVDH